MHLSIPVWTNNQVQFSFAGESGVTYVVESSADLQNWAPIATNAHLAVTRVVIVDASTGANFYRVRRTGGPRVAAGFAVKQGVSFNGNNITVDAYNSADTNHFPNGLWNSTNAFAGCNLATMGGVLDLGNAKIHGRLLLAPGAAYNIGPSGLVGDMPSNWSAQSGIEGPEWVCTNYQFDPPDVIVPYSSGLAPVAGSGTNSFVIGGGNYYVNGDFSISRNLQVDGSATTLYVTGNFSANNITIAPGAVLRLYVGQTTGPSVSATFGNVNDHGNSYDLQFFGLPNCTSIVMSGNNGYSGTVYAPEAALNVNAATVSFDYQGACVANSIALSGHVNLHFDRNLSR